jgi:phenylacetate-coenzyme A ligase PaaK-like adenylate-forming protein
MTNQAHALDALFRETDALRYGDEADQLFLAAVQEVFRHHYDNCAMYRAFCQQENFSPASLNSMADLPGIPWLMVNVFKRYHLTSVPEQQISKTFTSSGTSGQHSHISWDEASAARQSLMRQRLMESYRLTADQPVNYLCFSYDPQISGSKGAAFAHQMYTTFAPAREIFYAIHGNDRGDQLFDAGECVDRLSAYARNALPLRMVGFPAFAWRTLQELRKRDLRLCFAENSLIIFGGGWKTLADEAVSPEIFADHVEHYLGIPRTRIRDIYGFVEHGVPYVSCEAGHFHVPIYSRAFIRRPGTLELLTEGEKGLLQVVSPYNRAQPNLSVLSTDYAMLRSDCACGRQNHYILLQGRAGVKKHQGCAITAGELLKK